MLYLKLFFLLLFIVSNLNIFSKLIIDYIDSEGGSGEPVYINDIKLEGNKTSTDLQITWLGTFAEYLALESEGLINSETIYFVKDNSEGDIPPAQRSYEALANILKENGIDNVKMLIAVTENENANILIANL